MSRRSKRNVRRQNGFHSRVASARVEAQGQSRARWNRGWILGLVLVIGVVIAYQPVWHAGFIWDDDDYVTGNKLLTAPDGLWRIWFTLDSPSQYFPLTYTVLRQERALWGLNPAGYHLVNLLLHAANALLLWRLLRRLALPGAWLGAAIWALHPVQVESVAWVTEIKNVLMCFFFLLTLLAWVEFIEEGNGRRWGFYALALVFSVLALCAKTTACTLPVALFLILWLKEKPVHLRRLAEIAPFIAFGIGMGLLTVWWERYHQGTQGKLFAMGLVERVLVASRAVWFYVGKLLWPAGLTFSYPRWTISAASPLAYAWLVATAGLGLVIWRMRRRAGRGVEVAVLFFVATLAPVLGFIMLYTFVYSFVADHYQYVASIGLVALFSAWLVHAAGRLKPRRSWLETMVCIGLLLTLATLTWCQARIYQSDKTLWQATLDRNPACWMAEDNLGAILLHEGNADEAASHFQKALAINPGYTEAGNNLGTALLQQGRADESIMQFQKTLVIQPDYAECRYNLGNALLQKGRTDEAVAQFQKALAINPVLIGANNNLGLVFFKSGRIDEAVVQFQKELAINPNIAETCNNLGSALFQKGRLDEAAVQYQKALAIQPGLVEAQNGLARIAWLLATLPDESVRNGGKALQLAAQANKLSGGENPMMVATLAAACAEVGNFSDAITIAQRALQLAQSQSNSVFADEIQTHLKFYRADLPFRTH